MFIVNTAFDCLLGFVQSDGDWRFALEQAVPQRCQAAASQPINAGSAPLVGAAANCTADYAANGITSDAASVDVAESSEGGAQNCIDSHTS